MSAISRASRLALVALFLGALPSACASTRAGGAGSTPADEGAQGFDETLFLTDCRQGCRDAPTLCEAFCTCSAERIEASPELVRAAERAESGAEDAAAALDLVQGELIGACGADLYEHHFVGGCVGTCVEEGGETSACEGKCGCLFTSLRERHPGSEGLKELVFAFGAPELPAALVSELDAVRPACGF